jgi:hypothetical protein
MKKLLTMLLVLGVVSPAFSYTFTWQARKRADEIRILKERIEKSRLSDEQKEGYYKLIDNGNLRLPSVPGHSFYEDAKYEAKEMFGSAKGKLGSMVLSTMEFIDDNFEYLSIGTILTLGWNIVSISFKKS